MSLNEQSASATEIVVPTSLPMILKQFCKAAIRTQPYDLLKWSSSYFRALADGEEPPTKLRLEYPPSCTPSGLSLGFLRVLLRQFGDYNKLLPVETICRRWECLCLDRKELSLIMSIGRFRRRCQVKKFLAIAVSLLGSSLFDTMVMICELFTNEPDGGSAMIPVTLFMEIYGYLAGLRCDGSEKIEEVESTAGELSVNGEYEAGTRRSISESNPSLGLVHSMASQDTDADINLDLDLVSKEDPESARFNLGREVPVACALTAEAGLHENRNSEVSSPSSVGTLKGEKSPSPREDIPQERRTNGSPRESSSSQGENKRGKSIDLKDELQKFECNNEQVTGTDKKRGKSGESRRRHYPNIPGIGPRLSAEQVASVAIWLSECARLQAGMVGPRNLRHINCPPLDKEDSSTT